MPVTCSPLRYPGGKTKLYSTVCPILQKNIDKDCIYVEPFAGGAGLALKLLLNKDVSQIILNDIDESVFLFWNACLENTDELCQMVKATTPTLDEWDRQKSVYLHPTDYSRLERAFATLFLNRCNVSGIISGGPIGGRKQEGNYLINARYNPVGIIEKIKTIGARRNQISFYNMEASEFLDTVVSELPINRTLINIDPPYVKKGPSLYQNSFTEADHASLSAVIQHLKYQWILTYDECDLVKRLYKQYRQLPLSLSYSAGHAKQGSELMILGPDIRL